MKRPFPTENKDRFSGHLRHYHRTVNKAQRTWDEWVDGTTAPSGSTNRWKVFFIVIAVLALGGIITGLVIELR